MGELSLSEGEILAVCVQWRTASGETFASRHTFSHLSNVGLTEMVAGDGRGYIDLAVRLANDLPHLAEVRAGLRDRMARSPLCDGPRFAGPLMTLLRDAWRQWCRTSGHW